MPAPRKRLTARVIPPRHWPLLLRAGEAALYVGLSVSRFFDLRDADPTFPMPVVVPGRSVPLFRRDDLRNYVKTLPAALEQKRRIA